MRQTHSSGHGNHFAAQQRKLHPILTLSHTVTHRGHAACNLPHRVHAVQRFADQIRIVFVRLVGRKHVVIGGDDRDIVTQHAFQRRFIVWLTGGKTVRQVATSELRAVNRFSFGLFDTCQISRARIARPFDNAICYP